MCIYIFIVVNKIILSSSNYYFCPKISIYIIFIKVFIYKGFIAIKDFDLALTSKVQKIEEIAGVEKENQVIGLMMYTGYPLKLSELLLMSSEKKCLKKKKIAEENSFAFYECAEVNAIIKDGKIISIVEEIRVLE